MPTRFSFRGNTYVENKGFRINNEPKYAFYCRRSVSAGAKIRMLGETGDLRWEKSGKGVLIQVPETARKTPPYRRAWVPRIPSAGTSKTGF